MQVYYCSRGNLSKSSIKLTWLTIILLQQNLSIPKFLNASSDLSPLSIASLYFSYICATNFPQLKHLTGIITVDLLLLANFIYDIHFLVIYLRDKLCIIIKLQNLKYKNMQTKKIFRFQNLKSNYNEILGIPNQINFER